MHGSHTTASVLAGIACKGIKIIKLIFKDGRGLITLKSCICCLCSKILHQGQECLACINGMASWWLVPSWQRAFRLCMPMQAKLT